ncbi:hypothetical protein [Aquitalea sp. ASV11]|uniref:hypothetical protein n=1 Tax=Aquitalea sp. ASV11 TaxID=2795103 RepID=UPI0018ECD523|nr:hypothetical protein [Aquitalea sp. ASV11]
MELSLILPHCGNRHGAACALFSCNFNALLTALLRAAPRVRPGAGRQMGLTSLLLWWTVGAGFRVFAMNQPDRSKHAD